MKYKINPKYFFLTISISYLLILISWVLIETNKSQEILELKSAFYFNPIISNYIIEYFNIYVNPILIVFIKILIIPFTIFLLLIEIYRKYISLIWASLLSLTSLSIYRNFNFRDFIFTIKQFPKNNLQPLIFDFPIPGFSTLYFLTVYLIIVSIKKSSKYFLLLITFLVSIDFYINPIDALFLIGIWAVYLFIKSNRISNTPFIFYNYLLIFLIISFGLYNGSINPPKHTILTIPLYNIIVYIILPLLCMTILFFIKRIDKYEIYNRFNHVYIFMTIELIVIIISYSKILAIDLDILENRILQFFIHLFYYVPVIYFLAKPNSKVKYSYGSESSTTSNFLRVVSGYIYKISENLLVIVLIVLLISYNIFPLINTINR